MYSFIATLTNKEVGSINNSNDGYIHSLHHQSDGGRIHLLRRIIASEKIRRLECRHGKDNHGGYGMTTRILLNESIVDYVLRRRNFSINNKLLFYGWKRDPTMDDMKSMMDDMKSWTMWNQWRMISNNGTIQNKSWTKYQNNKGGVLLIHYWFETAVHLSLFKETSWMGNERNFVDEMEWDRGVFISSLLISAMTTKTTLFRWWLLQWRRQHYYGRCKITMQTNQSIRKDDNDDDDDNNGDDEGDDENCYCLVLCALLLYYCCIVLFCLYLHVVILQDGKSRPHH